MLLCVDFVTFVKLIVMRLINEISRLSLILNRTFALIFYNWPEEMNGRMLFR